MIHIQDPAPLAPPPLARRTGTALLNSALVRFDERVGGKFLTKDDQDSLFLLLTLRDLCAAIEPPDTEPCGCVTWPDGKLDKCEAHAPGGANGSA